MIRGLLTALSTLFLCGLLSACLPSARWNLGVLNCCEPLVFRVHAQELDAAWLLQADQAITLFDRSGPLSGQIELLNPGTCVVYSTIPIPAKSAVLEPTPDGKDPPGYTLGIDPEEAALVGPSAPNFFGCPASN